MSDEPHGWQRDGNGKNEYHDQVLSAPGEPDNALREKQEKDEESGGADSPNGSHEERVDELCGFSFFVLMAYTLT
jgi:hypothetical protein